MDEHTQPETYIVVREGGVWDLHCRAHEQGAVITPGTHGWPEARIKGFLRMGWIALNDGTVKVVPKATVPVATAKTKPAKPGKKKGK